MASSSYPPVTVPISVRFRDLDAYGHVNNAVFFTYLEEARIKLIGDYFRVQMNDDTVFVVSRAACTYKRPVELGLDLQVRMTVREMRRVSFIVDYVILDPEENIYATAETTLVAYDPVSRRATSLPEWLDDALKDAAAKWGNTPAASS